MIVDAAYKTNLLRDQHKVSLVTERILQAKWKKNTNKNVNTITNFILLLLHIRYYIIFIIRQINYYYL
jgi:hypothetical protein